MKTFGKNRRKSKRKMVGGQYTDTELGYIDGFFKMSSVHGKSPIIQNYLKGLESRNAGCDSYFFGTTCVHSEEYNAANQQGMTDFGLNDGTPPKHGWDLIGKIIELSDGDIWIPRKWRHPSRETWEFSDGYKAGYIDILTTKYPFILDDFLGYNHKICEDESSEGGCILGTLNGEGGKCMMGCKKNPEYQIGYDRGRLDSRAGKGISITTIPSFDPTVIQPTNGNTRIAPPQFGEEEISKIIMNSYGLWSSRNWGAPNDENSHVRALPSLENVNNWIPDWVDKGIQTHAPEFHQVKGIIIKQVDNYKKEKKEKQAIVDEQNRIRNKELANYDKVTSNIHAINNPHTSSGSNEPTSIFGRIASSFLPRLNGGKTRRTKKIASSRK